MSTSSVDQILSTLADLAPDSSKAPTSFIAHGDRVSLTYGALDLIAGAATGSAYDPSVSGSEPELPGRVEPLIKRASLHREEGLLRIGWLWVSGRSHDGTELMFPLVSVPAVAASGVAQRLSQTSGLLRRSGEPELSDLITDESARERLESTIEIGGGALDRTSHTVEPALLRRLDRLLDWGELAADASGHPTRRWSGALRSGRAERGDVRLLAKVMLYLAQPPSRSATIASTLRSWDTRHAARSALAEVYGIGSTRRTDPDSGRVDSSIVLSSSQKAAVVRTRHAALTVVSGAPGTGKTQMIAAAALDAIERDQSVLIAAPTDAAVDALVDLLTQLPGPDPIVFGATERRREVADRLGHGGGALVSGEEVDRRRVALEEAIDAATSSNDTIAGLLDAEATVNDPSHVHRARTGAPAWFDARVSLGDAQRLLSRIDDPDGWWSRFSHRRLVRRLARHADAPSIDLERLRASLRTATAQRSAERLEQAGGLDLDSLWRRLFDAEDARRRRKGDWLHAITHDERRVRRRSRATMAVVAAALRSGRSVRRRKLGEIDGRMLVEALPLWIGTMRDIDDLIPRSAAMFDLVFIDEASQVDQVSAAPALIRARRALVVGDPKQLRHVSFVSDAAVRSAAEANGITDMTMVGRLDVRRLSLFDLAASVAPTTFLDEHFRSAPHLIGFSSRRFYDGKLAIATAHPRNDALDCIAVDFVDGARDATGVNEVEIDAVLASLRALLDGDRGARRRESVGVVTPFRAHADALEASIVDHLSLEELDALSLRVGTVHGFQGCERDHVIMTLALDASSPAGARSFLGDANLFNVMVTRARQRISVITSLPTDAGGLIGDYLRYGSSPPVPAVSDHALHPLATELAGDLERASLPHVLGYRAGTHSIDLVLGAGSAAIGIDFGVHPDGARAHIERRMSLERSGWEIREVFASRWQHRTAELGVELALEAQARH